MSLENSLKRIADASEANTKLLESLVKTLQQTVNPVVAAPAAPAAAPAAPAAAPAAPATAPAAPAAPATAPAAPATAPAAPAALTPEALNAAIITEFRRLGERTKIDAEFTRMGATGVSDLPAERYQELLTNIRAIPA
jgi:hypothetical protein